MSRHSVLCRDSGDQCRIARHAVGAMTRLRHACDRSERAHDEGLRVRQWNSFTIENSLSRQTLTVQQRFLCRNRFVQKPKIKNKK